MSISKGNATSRSMNSRVRGRADAGGYAPLQGPRRMVRHDRPAGARASIRARMPVLV